METSTIIYTVAGAVIVLLPVLRLIAKKTRNVTDDKIVTLLGLIAKKIMGRINLTNSLKK